jgi:hypothetical protein
MGSGSEKLVELDRRVLLAGVPSVVPFGPEMRIVNDPASVLGGTFAPLWLMVRKRLGKICRQAAVSTPPENGARIALTRLH